MIYIVLLISKILALPTKFIAGLRNGNARHKQYSQKEEAQLSDCSMLLDFFELFNLHLGSFLQIADLPRFRSWKNIFIYTSWNANVKIKKYIYPQRELDEINVE